MSKGKKIFIIFFVFIFLAVLCFFFVKTWVRKNTSDGSGMANPVKIESLYYYYGQDEYGDSESIYLSDGSFNYYDSFISSETSDFNGTYQYDAEFEQSLENIVTSYEMKTWTNLQSSDFVLDDGPTITLKIQFDDGTVVELGDAFDMPENGWKAISEITDLFETYMKENDPEKKTKTDSASRSESVSESAQEIIPADDSGLTLLVDYCAKTLATGTEDGDGYSEIVLYQDKSDDSYQIHTYSRYGDEDEVHHAYTATEDTKDDVYSLIEEENLADYKGKKGDGMTGREYVVIFMQGDERIRITSDNFKSDETSKLTFVGSLLYDALPSDSDLE